MRLTPTTRNVLYGYGAFCVVNWALTYYAARSGSPFLFGSAGLLSLNETLRKANVLSYLVDPLDAAVKAGKSAAQVQLDTNTAGNTPTGEVCATVRGVTVCSP